MTNQEAIRLIRNLPTMCEFTDAYGEPIDSDAYYEAVDMAISTLEKRIPKKPNYKEEDRFVKDYFAVYTYCPVCEKEVGVDDMYCVCCGQAIDWRASDDE